MINLNDEAFAEKEAIKIFNKGKAGITPSTVKVVKKSAADADNAPEYKIIVTDADGGETNIGLFANIKETQLNFKGKELKHIASVFGYDCVTQGNSYEELLNKNMILLKDAVEGKVVNVLATYGMEGYPKKFIQPNSLFDFKKEGDDYINPKCVMVRPEATPPPANADGTTNVPSGGEDQDLPW